MEPILLEYFHDYKTGKIVGGLYLTEKSSKKVIDVLGEHFPEDKIKDIVFLNYELTFNAGEFAKLAFTDEEIRVSPDTYSLEPKRDSGGLYPIIFLGSKDYDDICIAKGVGFIES